MVARQLLLAQDPFGMQASIEGDTTPYEVEHEDGRAWAFTRCPNGMSDRGISDTYPRISCGDSLCHRISYRGRLALPPCGAALRSTATQVSRPLSLGPEFIQPNVQLHRNC